MRLGAEFLPAAPPPFRLGWTSVGRMRPNRATHGLRRSSCPGNEAASLGVVTVGFTTRPLYRAYIRFGRPRRNSSACSGVHGEMRPCAHTGARRGQCQRCHAHVPLPPPPPPHLLPSAGKGSGKARPQRRVWGGLCKRPRRIQHLVCTSLPHLRLAAEPPPYVIHTCT